MRSDIKKITLDKRVSFCYIKTMTREQFIKNYESDNEVEIGDNFDGGVNEPCHGGHCDENCDCWTSFLYALDAYVEEQS